MSDLPSDPADLTGLGTAFDRLAAERPDAPAITWRDVTTTRAGLSDEVSAEEPRSHQASAS